MKLWHLMINAVATLGLALGANAAQPPNGVAALATAIVGDVAAGASYLADGQVEAVRQTVIAAQVSGRIVALAVRAGDRVRSGQVLARVDPSAARQNQAAIVAQLAAARAQQVAAERNLERTRQLVAQKFLSPATLDRAEADQHAAAEAVRALIAQSAGAATQTGWHTVTAPFDAIVASVATEVGDTALPGKPLMQLHDPGVLRIAINVPSGVAARIDSRAGAQIEIPDAPGESRSPVAGKLTVVPAADPVSHTQLLRIELPQAPPGVHPGMFARVRLPLETDPQARAIRLSIPRSALVARGDLRAVYVVDERGAALRQVRLGRALGERIEVLAGLSAGERVALDPVAAARAAGAVVR